MHTKFWCLDINKEIAPQLKEAAECIRKGELVAFPTETVYGLGANGLDAEACKRIFAAKGRPADNPLILHIASPEEIMPLTSGLNANAKRLMECFWPGPMTLVVPRSSLVSDVVTAGLDTVAVRCPDHAVAAELIRQAGVPIAAPSANKSGRPSPTMASDVAEDMDGIIAGIIDGGECRVGLESTIIDTTSVIPTILRPGGITREMLEEVLGAVELDKGLVEEGVTPKAPGMKYRHYAPKAEMYIVEGDASGSLRMAEMAAAAGKKVALLGEKRLRPLQADMLFFPWENVDELANKFYDYLRECDRQGAELIISQGISDTELGLAVMNRMRKAAGKNIYKYFDGKLSLVSGKEAGFVVK